MNHQTYNSQTVKPKQKILKMPRDKQLLIMNQRISTRLTDLLSGKWKPEGDGIFETLREEKNVNQESNNLQNYLSTIKAK